MPAVDEPARDVLFLAGERKGNVIDTLVLVHQLVGYPTAFIIAPIGLFTFTYVALFVMARAAGVRLAAQTKLMQFVLALAFTFVHTVILLVLLAIFGRDAYVPRALYSLALPHVLATGVFAPVIFAIAQRLHSATTSARPTAGGAVA